MYWTKQYKSYRHLESNQNNSHWYKNSWHCNALMRLDFSPPLILNPLSPRVTKCHSPRQSSSPPPQFSPRVTTSSPPILPTSSPHLKVSRSQITKHRCTKTLPKTSVRSKRCPFRPAVSPALPLPPGWLPLVALSCHQPSFPDLPH